MQAGLKDIQLIDTITPESTADTITTAFLRCAAQDDYEPRLIRLGIVTSDFAPCESFVPAVFQQLEEKMMARSYRHLTLCDVVATNLKDHGWVIVAEIFT